MPDFLALLKAMAAALRGPAPLDWASIAPIIGLRFDGTRPVGRSGAASVTEGGSLIKEGIPIDGVIFQAPRPQIWLLFPDKALSEPDISAQRFAADQRIAESRTGRGYAIVFTIGGVSCAILVTEPGAFVDGLTVSDPGPTGQAKQPSIADARKALQTKDAPA
jgi:hypothetical protein